jgi:urease alpha subunit
MGDPNASIPTPQPVYMRPMFAAFGGAVGTTSLAFVSQAAIESGTVSKYRLTKKCVAVKDCRNLGKKDMRLNDATPKIAVDPETYQVLADGESLECAPANKLPLAQLYCLF